MGIIDIFEIYTKDIIMKRIILPILLFIISTTSCYAYVNMLFVSVAPQVIQFHIEDDNKKITGYTPQGNVYQIQYLLYRTNSISAVDESQIGYYDRYNEIRSNTTEAVINKGRYRLVVYGYNTSILAEINVETLWTELKKTHPICKEKILIYPNSVWTYEFYIPAMPPTNQQIVLTKTSTPTDLIKDLTIAGQLDYIGNLKFVSELTKEINEIEKNKILYEKDDTAIPPNQITKKEYQKLLTKITERYNKPEANKFVKKEAYTVLKEDLEYIIGHL